MTIEDLQAELIRLDPGAEDGATRCKLDGEDVFVFWSEGEDPLLLCESYQLKRVVQCLRMMPAGCPIEEGEDGSLWEVLLEIECGTVGAAMAYIREHHDQARPAAT